jgi:DNA recombination protein Rad52
MIDTEKLKLPLNDKFISYREIGKTQVGYVESHHVIREANNIFGFGDWSYTIKELKNVSNEIKMNKYNKELSYCGYIAVVTVTVKNENDITTREDVGFGNGIDADVGKSHEGATKEAVTDALKRCLRTFGDSFGLALYAKDGSYIFTETISEDTIEEFEKALIDRNISNEAINKAWGIRELKELHEKSSDNFRQWLKQFPILKPCTEQQIKVINDLIVSKSVDIEKFLKAYQVFSVSELSFESAKDAITKLTNKK